MKNIELEEGEGKFVNPVNVQIGYKNVREYNSVITFIHNMIINTDYLYKNEQNIIKCIDRRIEIIKRAIELADKKQAKYPIIAGFDEDFEGPNLLVSEQDRTIILSEDISIRHDRLKGFNDLVKHGRDMFDSMIIDITELKTIAICYKYNLEEWIDKKQLEWTDSKKDILDQIQTMLQGFKI